jgi:hypothetical protein
LAIRRAKFAAVPVGSLPLFALFFIAAIVNVHWLVLARDLQPVGRTGTAWAEPYYDGARDNRRPAGFLAVPERSVRITNWRGKITKAPRETRCAARRKGSRRKHSISTDDQDT